MIGSPSELEVLRRAFAFDDGGSSVDDLPGAERIWSAVRGDSDPEEIAALAEIAVANPDLVHEWQLARALNEAPLQAAGVLTRLSYLAPALAAAAVLMVAIVPLLWRQAPDHGPVYRGSDGPVLQSEILDVEVLPRDDFVLRWTDMGAAAVYTVTVMTADLEKLTVMEGLRRPEARIPEEVLTSIGGSDQILWRVDAALGDGRFAESRTFVVRIE